jgi:hypothetical protein
LDTGLSFELTFSAMYEMIFDLLIGFAIELTFPPRIVFAAGSGVPDAAWDYSRTPP